VSAASVLWLPLGELLVERGLLSTVQLELALGEQRRTGLRLGEVLVSMGYVSEAALARMLLEQVGLSAPPEPPIEEVVEQPEVNAAPDVPRPMSEPQFFVEPVVLEAPVPEPQPEPVVIEAPVPERQPEPELRVAVEPEPQPEPTPEPVIIRMEDTPRDRGKWWSRNGNRSRVRELEKVLSDFEERSRAIEADIMRVRTTLRNLRDAGS
jgi:outer membrane biosynthesis protein TonB